LKKLHVVELKEFHKREEAPVHSNHSSQERKKFNLRFKFKENTSNTIIRTEGNDSSDKNPYLKKIVKNATPTKLASKADEWKFISIQLKEDLTKPNNKNRKTEVKISSHRSYNLQTDKAVKIKSNSSMNKYLDKVARIKEEGRATREEGRANRSKF
jgi:hypothetical protein